MPTYEYLCEKCAYRFEKREGFDAPARQKCEKCRKNTAQRMLFAPPIVFKGTGFYKTDSRGADTSEAAASSSNGASKSDDAAAAPAAVAASTGHGHSHGPDGHSHASEATPAPAASDRAEKPKSAKDTPKPAAAS